MNIIQQRVAELTQVQLQMQQKERELDTIISSLNWGDQILSNLNSADEIVSIMQLLIPAAVQRMLQVNPDLDLAQLEQLLREAVSNVQQPSNEGQSGVTEEVPSPDTVTGGGDGI